MTPLTCAGLKVSCEWYGELVLKNSVFESDSFSSGAYSLRSFLSCCLRACGRWFRSQAEEPHQSFQILCHRRQVELLTHELDSA